MSTGEQQAPELTTQAAEATAVVSLDDIIRATKNTPREQTEGFIRTLVDQSLANTVSFDKNVTKTIKSTIEGLDRQISRQLAEIMHHPELQKLEGTWRGLNYLVMNTETSASLKLKVLNIPKKELYDDLDKAVEFDQSQIFKKIYETEFGSPGGEPYGALIGDYEFTNHPEDIDLLGKMSNVAAAAFCPFVSAASPGLFGFNNWEELTKPRDLEKIFLATDYIKWRSYRDSEDSRFVTLAMPRVLPRLPYGAETKPVEQFDYEEVDSSKPVAHDQFTWM